MTDYPAARKLLWPTAVLLALGCATPTAPPATWAEETLPAAPAPPPAPSAEPIAAPTPPAAAPEPEVILEVAPAAITPTPAPTVALVEPKEEQSIEAGAAGTFSVRLKLTSWKSELGGTRVHVGLDRGPYKAFYDLDDIELRDLVEGDVAPGDHLLVAFAVTEDGIAVKAPGALAVRHFWVGPKGTASFLPGAPLVIQNQPSGDYGGSDASAVPVDFLVHNAELGEGKHSVAVMLGESGGRAAGAVGSVSDPGARVLRNLPDGDYRVGLNLVGPAGAIATRSAEQPIGVRHQGRAAAKPTEREKRISRATIEARRCLSKARYRSGILVVPKKADGKTTVELGWGEGLKPKDSVLACVRTPFAPLTADLGETIVQVGRMVVPGDAWGADAAGKTKVRTKKGKMLRGRIEGRLVYRSEAMSSDGQFVAVWITAPGEAVSTLDSRSVVLNGSKELAMCVVTAPTKDLVEKVDDGVSICELAGPLMMADGKVLTRKDGRTFSPRRGRALPKDGPNAARAVIVGSFRGKLGVQDVLPNVQLVDGGRTVTLEVGKDL